MADVHQAADQISEIILQWIDANDLDQTLEGLHELPRAMESSLHHYAEQLRENTNLKESIPEAIAEAAGDMNGIADKLRDAIDFGVQRG